MGGSQLLVFVALQDTIAKAASGQGRDRAVSSFSLFVAVGLLLGPLIGGYSMEQLGFAFSYILLSLLSLVPLVFIPFFSWAKPSAESGQLQERHNMWELICEPNLGRTLIVSMMILSSLDILNVYFPILASHNGLSSPQIGWLLTIQGGAGAVVRLLLPALVKRYSRVRILWAFMLVGAIAYSCLAVFKEFSQLLVIYFVLGFGLGIVQPLTIILTSNAAPQERIGEALGARLAANRIAQIIIPFLFASVSTQTGLALIFIFKGVLLFVGGWVAKGIKENIEEDQQTLSC